MFFWVQVIRLYLLFTLFATTVEISCFSFRLVDTAKWGRNVFLTSGDLLQFFQRRRAFSLGIGVARWRCGIMRFFAFRNRSNFRSSSSDAACDCLAVRLRARVLPRFLCLKVGILLVAFSDPGTVVCWPDVVAVPVLVDAWDTDVVAVPVLVEASGTSGGSFWPTLGTFLLPDVSGDNGRLRDVIFNLYNKTNKALVMLLNYLRFNYLTATSTSKPIGTWEKVMVLAESIFKFDRAICLE